jgi:hypothetical protein
MTSIIMLLASLLSVSAATTGITTRYWDCCKPSCSWLNKAPVTRPVITCAKNNTPLVSPNLKSGCEGGPSFACGNQAPFAINSTFSYGFAAVAIKNKLEYQTCCACYELVFASPPIKGKRMIVQATNIGYDLTDNHFDIAIPGGGQGIFQGCNAQYANFQGGQRYGGVQTINECQKLPSVMRPGCLWRFRWFQNADNPRMTFKSVPCPRILTDITKCRRTK